MVLYSNGVPSHVTRWAGATQQPEKTDAGRPGRRACRNHQRDRSAGDGKQPNISATAAAPTLCPSSRDVACIPLAAPALVDGADVMIARLFGVLKNPNPMPQISIRQTMSMRWMGRHHAEQCQFGRDHGKPEATEQPGRVPVGKPSGERCDHRNASGQGVNSRPVSSWPRPSVFSNRNGNETSAMLCATTRSTWQPKARILKSATGPLAASAMSVPIVASQERNRRSLRRTVRRPRRLRLHRGQGRQSR